MLSIIIPIYNIEHYLSDCLNSLISHIKCDYELILIDDGSTDNSAKICDDYAAKHDNIYVVHQANSGVSVARNTGIEKARGEWIWFVDGDDYIETDVCIPEADDKQMMVMGCIWEENGLCVSMPPSTSDIPYNTWRCLFRRDEIEKHNLRFISGRRYAEDQEFIITYLLLTNCYDSIKAISDNIYHYTVRPGSAVMHDGRKLVMLRDIFCVLTTTLFRAIRNGMICRLWVLGELKRLTKTLLTTALR